jgi:hypothetical protein
MRADALKNPKRIWYNRDHDHRQLLLAPAGVGGGGRHGEPAVLVDGTEPLIGESLEVFAVVEHLALQELR